MRLAPMLALTSMFMWGEARAGSSYVLPDGINRAPPVTLHCVTPSGTAAPCGTVSAPLVVTSPSGGPSAARQQLQLGAEQSSAQALGGLADTAFTGGQGSVIQGPSTSGAWINVMGGVAAPNGMDCAYFAPGSFYESGQFINRGAISVYVSSGAMFSAWED